jgi:hypothetical protein
VARILKEAKVMYHNVFRINLLYIAIAMILAACAAASVSKQTLG